MRMNVYGYQFYLDGEIAAWSDTFFLTRKEVKEYMQRHVRKICQEISDNLPIDSGFVWNDRFEQDNPNSCFDEEEFNDCLESYNRIQFMVGPKGCSQIYEGVTDASNELENNCPYKISWHIVPYKVEMPMLIFGQVIALDIGEDEEYRMPHLTAAYPDSAASRKQVIKDLVTCLSDVNDLDEDKLIDHLEKAGLANFRSEKGGVITIFEANILTTECKLPDPVDDGEED